MHHIAQGSSICMIATLKVLIDWSGRHIATVPSIDDSIPFGGDFHAPNTNIRQMSRKNIV